MKIDGATGKKTALEGQPLCLIERYWPNGFQLDDGKGSVSSIRPGFVFFCFNHINLPGDITPKLFKIGVVGYLRDDIGKTCYHFEIFSGDFRPKILHFKKKKHGYRRFSTPPSRLLLGCHSIVFSKVITKNFIGNIALPYVFFAVFAYTYNATKSWAIPCTWYTHPYSRKSTAVQDGYSKETSNENGRLRLTRNTEIRLRYCILKWV